jgi:hypothetical protein
VTFKKGESGNPAGRKRGSVNYAALRKQIRTKEILAVVEAAALGGDMTAARLLLERSLPALRPVDSPVTLPAGDGLADTGRATISALSAGAVTPVEAGHIMAAVSGLARIVEMDELIRRIEVLEAARHDPKP